jgi:hypothetical protein
MDMLAFLEAKAARCRYLAGLSQGESARALLAIAAEAEADASRLQRRLEEVMAFGRRDRAARLPWRIRGTPTGRARGKRH